MVDSSLNVVWNVDAYVRALTPFLSAGEVPEIHQTHLSLVLLVDHLAFKIKKPVRFDFVDYSTPALRLHYCAEEVRLNARLAPGVYLGIAPIIALNDGHLVIGRLMDDVELSGMKPEDGNVVDYTVVMRRLPDEATLLARLHSNTLLPEHISGVAQRLAAFHRACAVDHAEFGSRDAITGDWDENFTAMRPLIGTMLDQQTYDSIDTFVQRFLTERFALFALRQRTDSIREGHGDLRLEHIYLFEGQTTARPQMAIVDCVEFADRYRYADIANEIAFLMMELDAAGSSDLSRTLVMTYSEAMHDETLKELLPFYGCYRACIRGKVLALQAMEVEVPEAQRQMASDQAQRYFRQAKRYTTGKVEPIMLLIGGLPGTGKSTLAAMLCHEFGWARFSADVIRKELAGRATLDPQRTNLNLASIAGNGPSAPISDSSPMGQQRYAKVEPSFSMRHLGTSAIGS